MEQYIIGSAPTPASGQTPVPIADPNNHVSRTHCQITVDGNNTVIQDLNSRNGTFVDGIKISSPVRLTHNSSVMLAGTYHFDHRRFIASTTDQVHSPPQQNIQDIEQSLVAGQVNYAPFASRVFAFLVDGFIIGLPVWFFSFFLRNAFFYMPLMLFLIQMGAFLVIAHFYFVIPVSTKGTTIGRKMFGIEYLSLETMDYPNQQTVWLRLFGYAISSFLFGIGFLMPLFDSAQQALHDKIAKTIVVTK